MKQIFIIILVLCGLSAAAQNDSFYTTISSRYKWLGGMFERQLVTPRGSSNTLNGGKVLPGSLFYNTLDTSLYSYSGYQWRKIGLGVYDGTNGISLSSTNFKLGGSLSENTTVNARNYFFRMDSANHLRFMKYRAADSSTSRLDFPTSSSIGWRLYYEDLVNSYDGATAGIQAEPLGSGVDLVLWANQGTVPRDVLRIQSEYHRLAIMTDSVQSTYLPLIEGVDTTYKPLVIGPDHLWRRMQYWPSGGGSGSYSAGSGLTLSGSTFKLGGTITEHTTIYHDNYDFALSDGREINLTTNDNSAKVRLLAKKRTSAPLSEIQVLADSILVNPSAGVLNFDSLLNQNRTTDKMVVWDSLTGRVGARTIPSGGNPFSANLTFTLNNTYDIGTSLSSGAPRTGYFATSLKAPYIYCGDRTTTYGGYVGLIIGQSGANSVMDFYSSTTRIGEFYTTSGGFNFFTDSGKDLSFFTNNSFTAPAIYASTGQLIGLGTATPTNKLDVVGSLGLPITSVTTNTTLNGNHFTVIIPSGTPTITLPAANTCANRIHILVNKTGANVTVSSYTDKTGASATVIPLQSSITLQSDGSVWQQIQ